MEDVTTWLKTLGLERYAACFAENDISFAILSDLSDQDLKEIGVSSLGHRRQLLRAIAERSQASAALSHTPSGTWTGRKITASAHDIQVPARRTILSVTNAGRACKASQTGNGDRPEDEVFGFIICANVWPSSVCSAVLVRWPAKKIHRGHMTNLKI
jgi:hypothetical protein